jgi:hypothetical protein
MHSAIELAKVYAKKYGGKNPTIHGFEAQLPSKIKIGRNLMGSRGFAVASNC